MSGRFLRKPRPFRPFALWATLTVGLVVWLFGHEQEASASADHPSFSVVQGFGTGFGLSATRVGIGAWEGGLLNVGTNMSTYGVIRTFRTGGLYASVGPIIIDSQLLGPTSPGVFASTGYELGRLLGFFTRFELNAEVTFGGNAQASSMLMVAWGWW